MDAPTLTPLAQHIGVAITDVTAADLLSDSAAATCRQALDRYGVVVYPQVNISDEQLVAFSRLLGTVVANPTAEHALPEIATITLDPAKTRATLAGYRQGNFLWHIDGATDPLPQKATLLTARVVDDSGGDTEFATTYAAYDALPAATRDRIEHLRVVHSFAAAQRRTHPDATAEQQQAWDSVPSRIHPLVWKRRDGRRSLLLGATAGEVLGLPGPEGTALLDELLEFATSTRFTLAHHWQVGDLVIWDNTGMLHRAQRFDPTSARLMHRTTLVGEEEVA